MVLEALILLGIAVRQNKKAREALPRELLIQESVVVFTLDRAFDPPRAYEVSSLPGHSTAELVLW